MTITVSTTATIGETSHTRTATATLTNGLHSWQTARGLGKLLFDACQDGERSDDDLVAELQRRFSESGKVRCVYTRDAEPVNAFGQAYVRSPDGKPRGLELVIPIPDRPA